MSRRPLSERLVERWVRCYTIGLPDTTASERRDELRSDVWESRAAGVSGREILRRAAVGAPADVVWRCRQGLVAPWLRPAVHLGVIAVLLLTLASVQHATGTHTLVGNAAYGLWFCAAGGSMLMAVVGAWRRFRR